MATKTKKKTAKSSKKPTSSKKKATSKATPKKRVKVATKPAAKKVSTSKSKQKAITLKKVDLTKAKEMFSNTKALRALGWFVATLTALFLVDMMVQYINNDFSAAVVNNKRITESELEVELKDRAGEQILADMITKELVYQEAKNNGVSVTNEEVDAEFDKTAEKSGGQESFEAALQAYNFTVESYKETLKFEMTIQKMIVSDPSEDDLQTFFDENKDTYFSEQAAYSDDKANVKDTYTQVMYQSEVTNWLQALEAEATIQNNITDKPNYGFFKATRNIFGNVYDNLTSNVK